ncbi:hypothetical protein E2562_010647 [Oryza meyeriana var. granulata]|uniref:Uncharacterized protein n=1 Tax=Oryza meyeriana var. granulata TaxID=110450 RepID=A0A6G1EVW4_9ORYZ|nr:hypothetical protein E2562_010647 [Oryza meyeriana var. granulata]
MARRVPYRPRARAVAVSRSEGSIQDRGRAGGSGTEDALHMFDELPQQGRGAPIYSLNRALTDVACDSPAVAVFRFNRMARAGADKVTPDLHTYAILIGCCCRVGRLDLGFAAFGNAQAINKAMETCKCFQGSEGGDCKDGKLGAFKVFKTKLVTGFEHNEFNAVIFKKKLENIKTEINPILTPRAAGPVASLIGLQGITA